MHALVTLALHLRKSVCEWMDDEWANEGAGVQYLFSEGGPCLCVTIKILGSFCLIRVNH